MSSNCRRVLALGGTSTRDEVIDENGRSEKKQEVNHTPRHIGDKADKPNDHHHYKNGPKNTYHAYFSSVWVSPRSIKEVLDNCRARTMPVPESHVLNTELGLVIVGSSASPQHEFRERNQASRA